VVSPDGLVVPDVLEKLPGRGIWVSADRSALETAVKKKAFARAARQLVELPDDLVGIVEGAVARHVVELLGLARKSGDAVAGYEKVKDWLDKERATVLIQASDGSGRGKSKLSTPHYGKFIGWLTMAEIGQAFGRQQAVHAALAAGGLAKRVVEEAQRLKGLRADPGGQRPA
jgi:predicted RNA-binding protein YlxR (DUF448 family)